MWAILVMPFIKKATSQVRPRPSFSIFYDLSLEFIPLEKSGRWVFLNMSVGILVRACVQHTEVIPSSLEYISYAFCGLRIKAFSLN